MLFLFFFFFFQAEDGIRDTSVTGVQTCALPIFNLIHKCIVTIRFHDKLYIAPTGLENVCGQLADSIRAVWRKRRSEERRVGKECRYEWWWYEEKENNRVREERGVGRGVEFQMWS